MLSSLVIPYPLVIPCLTRNLDSKVWIPVFTGMTIEDSRNDNRNRRHNILSIITHSTLSFRPRVKHGVTLLDAESRLWRSAFLTLDSRFHGNDKNNNGMTKDLTFAIIIYNSKLNIHNCFFLPH